MFKKLLAAIAVVTVGAYSSFAADIAYKAPPMVQRGVDWTGWFAGVSFGYMEGQTSPFLGGGVASVRLKPDGFQTAIHGGYDYQISNSNWVLGTEVSVPLLRLSDSKIDPAVPAFTYSARDRWAVFATGKVGYAIGNWLPYVGGGFGFVGTSGNTFAPGFVTREARNTHDGMLGIAGLRYMINPNWWVGMQYMHGQFSTETYSTVPVGVPFDDRQIGFRMDSIMAQVSYKFTNR